MAVRRHRGRLGLARARCTPRPGSPPRLPHGRLARERADLCAAASRSATRRAAAGRRCSRNTSRSRTALALGAARDRARHRVTVEHRRKRAAARVVKMPFFNPERKRDMSAITMNDIRRDRHRRRPQRPRVRRLPRARRQAGPRARAAPPRRRRGRHRGDVFPGFKFSVFSYVVSLLRPEIIRDLELPRHGLQILPLESTRHAAARTATTWRSGPTTTRTAASSRATRRATPRPTTNSAG